MYHPTAAEPCCIVDSATGTEVKILPGPHDTAGNEDRAITAFGRVSAPVLLPDGRVVLCSAGNSVESKDGWAQHIVLLRPVHPDSNSTASSSSLRSSKHSSRDSSAGDDADSAAESKPAALLKPHYVVERRHRADFRASAGKVPVSDARGRVFAGLWGTAADSGSGELRLLSPWLSAVAWRASASAAAPSEASSKLEHKAELKQQQQPPALSSAALVACGFEDGAVRLFDADSGLYVAAWQAQYHAVDLLLRFADAELVTGTRGLNALRSWAQDSQGAWQLQRTVECERPLLDVCVLPACLPTVHRLLAAAAAADKALDWLHTPGLLELVMSYLTDC